MKINSAWQTDPKLIFSITLVSWIRITYIVLIKKKPTPMKN